MSRILMKENGFKAIMHMQKCGVDTAISMPSGMSVDALTSMQQYTDDPVVRLCALLTEKSQFEHLVLKWKMKGVENKLGLFIMDEIHQINLASAKAILVNTAKQSIERQLVHVTQALLYRGRVDDAKTIMEWAIPVFPLGGKDFQQIGLKGRAVGHVMQAVKEAWIVSEYTMDKAALLNIAVALPPPSDNEAPNFRSQQKKKKQQKTK